LERLGDALPSETMQRLQARCALRYHAPKMRLTTVAAIQSALALFTGFVAVSQFITHPQHLAAGRDRVGPVLQIYRSLASDLPASGYIGFVETLDDPVHNAANYFVAQYALAPRVVVNAFDERAEYLITGVNSPRSTAGDARLRRFVVVRVAPSGVLVLRKVSG
jgi:hypothetical protein